MSPELGKVLAIIVPLVIISLSWMALRLLHSAGKSMVEARTVDPVSLALVVLILVLVLVGVRYYPPMLGRAFLDGFTELWGLYDEIVAVVTNVANESEQSWNSGDNADAPVTISQPTPQFTSTPMPTAENQTNYDATATAYFEGTAMPSEPTTTPTWSNQDFVDFATTMATKYPTPKPTIFVCKESADHARGCLPPTPIPGN